MTAIVISIIIQTCSCSHIGVVSIPDRPFDNYSMARTRRLETTPKNCRNVRLFDFRPFELSRMCLKRLSKMHVITCVKAKDLRVPLRGYRSSEEWTSRPKMGADQVVGEKDSETGGFVNMKRVERDYFCDRLAIQGKRLKLLLENLNEEARAHYLVKEFSKSVLVMENHKKRYKCDRSSFAALRKYWW